MLKTIAKKEFLSLWRDRRFGIMGVIVLLLLLTATGVGYLNYQKIQAERADASLKSHEQWLNQGAKNPHNAAHYGSFAYRPKSPLSFMDFGTDSYTGMSVRLEAHKQSDAQFSTAQDSSSLIRFGELTVAFVLQILMPLLIIFLCFNAFTQEKEEKTLQILLSQGVSIKQLAWGKIVGFSGVIGVLVLPILVLIGIVLSVQTDTQFTTAYIGRTVLLTGCYLAYLFVFVMISVWISARASTSRNALLALLAIWIFGCIIIPKATVNIATNLHPIPSSFAFNKAIREDEDNGINGHDPEDARAKVLLKQVLAKYKVDSVSQLPVNFDGIQMQMAEKYMAAFPQIKYDTAKGRRQELFWVAVEHFNDEKSKVLFSNYKQEMNKKLAFAKSLSWLSPAIQLQTSLNQLANTDTDAHLNFVENIEEFFGRFKGFFDLKVITNQKFKEEDFDKIPVAEFEKSENFNVFSGFWKALIFIGFFGALGVFGIKKSSIYST